MNLCFQDIFNVHQIDLQGLGRAFGFTVPPRVDVNFGPRGDKSSRQGLKKKVSGKVQKKDITAMKRAGMTVSSGHVFSAENPYGKRLEGDKRQFSR